MTTVLKIGGSVLEPEPAPALAQALARRVLAGERLCVVHGGGKALTATLEQLKIASQFRDGLRVTDGATLAAAMMVLAGFVNKKLVAALNGALAAEAKAGAAAPVALGLCGVDGRCLIARVADPALGYVGEISGGDARLLRTLLEGGYVPVLASIAAHADAGASVPALNVNADSFAAACAAQLHAERLVFVTDVPGVLDATGQTIPLLRLPELEALGRAGVAKAGMLPKLAACRVALEAGVASVEITGARAFLAAAADAGTRVILGRPAPAAEPAPSPFSAAQPQEAR